MAPIFNSPAALTLLAVFLALSAYLKKVMDDRETLIDKINEGKKRNKYPRGAPHTIRKLEQLEESHRRLDIVSPVVIGCCVATLVRLIAWGISVLPTFATNQPLQSILRWADITILTFTLILFIVLWVMHYKTQNENTEIKTLEVDWRAAQATKVTPA